MPDDPELAARQRQLELATLDAKIAEQRALALSKAVPGATTASLAGTLVVDDKAVIESQIFAHRALRVVAAQIAAAVKGVLNGRVQGATVVLQSVDGLAELTAWQVFRTQMEALADAFDMVAPPTDARRPPPPIPAVPAGVVPVAPAIAAAPVLTAGVTAALAMAGGTARAALDVISLLRENVTVAGRAITVEQGALVSAVAGCLAREGLEVRVPRGAGLAGTAAVQAVLARLSALHDAEHSATARVAALPDDAAQAAALSRLADLAQASQQCRVGALGLSVPLATGDAAAGGLTTALPAALSVLLRGHTLETLVGRGGVIVATSVLTAGGAYRTEQWLWRSQLTYSGGVVVQYVLLGPDGTVIDADVCDAYDGGAESYGFARGGAITGGRRLPGLQAVTTARVPNPRTATL